MIRVSRGTRRPWAATITITTLKVVCYCCLLLLTVVVVSTGTTPRLQEALFLGGHRGRAAVPPTEFDDDHHHQQQQQQQHPVARRATTLWTTRRGAASAHASPAFTNVVVDCNSSNNEDALNRHHDNKAAAAAAAAAVDDAKRQLLLFLKSGNLQAEEEGLQDEFHIHGWRWHTMSLIREASRLTKTAHKLSMIMATKTQAAGTRRDDDDNDNNVWALDDLMTAANYVVNFNMRGLHKIETTLFFPWVRQRILSQLSSLSFAAPTTGGGRQEEDSLSLQQVAASFGTVMNQLECQRETVEQLGAQLNGLLLFSDSSLSKKKNSKNQGLQLQHDDVPLDAQLVRLDKQEILDRVASTSRAIVQCTQSMLDLEEAVLVPMVARLVPAAEQTSFNNKVIMNLGMLDSRLHLVGMHQAVVSCKSNNSNNNNNKKEQRLFQECIPSFPQGMIPRWKRLLYDPQVAIFQRILRDDE